MNMRGQIWLETVIYTLIGLALIGLALAIITPKINGAKDRALVEQSMTALASIDDKILDAADHAPGNTRIIDQFSIHRGSLIVDSSNDLIYFSIDGLTKPYSEVGVPIHVGHVTVLSQELQKTDSVLLTLNYTGVLNITYGSERAETIHQFAPAAQPYRFSVTNWGPQRNVNEVNFQEISGA